MCTADKSQNRQCCSDCARQPSLRRLGQLKALSTASPACLLGPGLRARGRARLGQDDRDGPHSSCHFEAVRPRRTATKPSEAAAETSRGANRVTSSSFGGDASPWQMNSSGANVARIVGANQACAGWANEKLQPSLPRLGYSRTLFHASAVFWPAGVPNRRGI